MRKLIFLAIALSVFSFCFINTISAQGVGINSSGNAPDPSAILDASSTTQGALMPRVALTSTTVSAPVSNPANSLLVYNTATAGDVTPGFYYWNGTKWVRLISTVATNSSTSDGVVVTGAGQVNLVWKTDALGNPGWRADETGGSTCPVAPSGQTLINYNGCLYVKNSDESGTFAWDNALTQCTGLGAGWYLPDRIELDVLYQNWNVGSSQCQGGPCPLSGFSTSTPYWSSKAQSINNTTAWYLFFPNGNTATDSKGTSYKVRCVRR